MATSTSALGGPFTTFTNLGPLTTTSFPADCLASLWDFNTPELIGTFTYQTQGCAVKTCCPSGNFYTEAWAWMTSYYSPGVCPSQYRSCDPPPPPTALSSEEGETIVFCCPTNYACPYTTESHAFYFCQSLLSTSTNVVVLDNIFDQKTLSTRSFVLPAGIANEYQLAYPIQIRTRTGSTTSIPSTVPGPTTSVPSTAPSTTSTSSGQSSATSTTQTHSSLSTGAIVGISIGAFIAVCLFVAGVLFFVYKSRSRRRAARPQAVGGPEYYKPELDGRGVPAAVVRSELPVPDQILRAELPAKS